MSTVSIPLTPTPLPAPGAPSSTPPTSSSVEEAYRPAFEEISRRSDAAPGATLAASRETTYFSRSSTFLQLPFRLPGQEYALLTMGTAVLAPRPVDSSRPSLRIYGVFASREEAAEHAEVVRALDATCSLVVVKTHEWMMMPQTESARDDREEMERRKERRLRAHREQREAEERDFEAMVTERRAGHVSASTADLDGCVDDADAVETREAEAEVYKAPRRLRSGGEVRGQAAVALSVLPDTSGMGECLFTILGVFETAGDADAWVRNVASRHVVDEDVVVAPTCEWLYPNATQAKSATRHYRVDELQRIMDAAEKNPEAVRDYKAWKREQDEKKKREEDQAEEVQAPDAASTSGEGSSN